MAIDFVNSIFVPLLLKLLEKKLSHQIKRSVIRKYKKNITKLIDSHILMKYGEQTFYNKLSRCVFKNLDKIFEACYQQDNGFFLSDRITVESILSVDNWEPYEETNARLALQYIIDKTFNILNTPSNESERKITNVTLNCAKQILNGLAQIKEIIVENKNTAIQNKVSLDYNSFSVSDCIEYKMLSNDNYNVILEAADETKQFIVTIWVKYLGEIQKFESGDEFLGYLNFTGKTGNLEITEISVKTHNGDIIFEKNFSEQCARIKLGPFFVSSIDLRELRNIIPTLEISPNQKELMIDIENEDGEKVITFLKLKILRELLPSGELEVKLYDVREQRQENISIVYLFNQNGDFASDINISVSEDHHAQSWLSYYIILKRFMVSKNIIYRFSKTRKIFGHANQLTTSLSLSNIEENISFYKKLIKIQDYFNLEFCVSGQIYHDDIEWVDALDSLIEKGYYKNISKVITLQIDNIGEEDFDNFLKESSYFLFQANISFVELIGCRLEFNDDLVVLFPKAYIEEHSFDTIKVHCISESILVYKKKYDNYNTETMARKILSGEEF